MAVLFLPIITAIFIVINFLKYLIDGTVFKLNKIWAIVQIWTVVIVPICFLLLMDVPNNNDCCSDSAVFSPDHRFLIYILIGTSMFAYIISVFRKKILPPIQELFLHAFLILGLLINIFCCKHLTTIEEGPIWWVIGNIPIIMLILISISENQKFLKGHIERNELQSSSLFGKIATSILSLKAIYLYPILTICLIPIIVFLSLFLILFGQKPDSLVRAFTDTYKHGFSELDYMCDNVQCGGHFLCSVGANGHKYVVKPVRYGERLGNKIICNRQLLISNAFEELIQENLPLTHKFIRTKYNLVGKSIHKHYHLFNYKYVSDIVYILMKPLELIFLITLYTFDSNPENRINTQYLNNKDIKRIDDLQHYVKCKRQT
jgi:hypothetical protein